jgi:FkbM family methyltransferase
MFTKIRLLLQLIGTVQNWWIYLTQRLRKLKKGTFTYATRSGIHVCLRSGTSDAIVFNDIWLDHVYDAPEIRWGNVRTVLDIGAHVGIFALYALSRAPQVEHVFSYEPEPGNLQALRENVRLNNAESRITVRDVAVAGTAGTMRLNVMPGRGEQNSLFRQTEASTSIDVPVVTLQDILEKEVTGVCDLAKINCEGAEYDMLYTLPAACYERMRCIVMNYHLFSLDPKHHPTPLTAHLQERGYTVRKLSEGILVAARNT